MLDPPYIKSEVLYYQRFLLKIFYMTIDVNRLFFANKCYFMFSAGDRLIFILIIKKPEKMPMVFKPKSIKDAVRPGTND